MVEPITLEMEGAARRKTRSRSLLVRPAVPAENMMQAFIWHHLVPVENWNVVVSGRPAPKQPLQVVMPAPRLMLPRPGEFLLSLVPLGKAFPPDQWRVQLSEPPEGLTATVLATPMGGAAIELKTGEGIEPGLRGNLILGLSREYTPEPTESDAAPKTRQTNYGLLPAIPFEVSERTTYRR